MSTASIARIVPGSTAAAYGTAKAAVIHLRPARDLRSLWRGDVRPGQNQALVRPRRPSLPVRRRTVLQATGAIAVTQAHTGSSHGVTPPKPSRVRPADPGWPDDAAWQALGDAVGGRLAPVRPLLAACENDPTGAACQQALRELRNPYALADQAAGTQTSGWIDAWRSAPSAYALTPRSAPDVAAAVDFARRHRVRVVVRGGGHSYLGGSNAPDSLLIWMRDMDRITLHDAFVGEGCDAVHALVPAVSVGTGARWMPVYNAVTTAAGRYVQGGGCTTVGVAGLVLGNGFGSFSKRYGSAASSLLEAEIVTADGAVRIANACRNPELLWALKGAGHCGFGVVTRLTLRTHALPALCGFAIGAIRARDDDAFRRLVARFTQLCATSLVNPHWGESVSIQPNNVLTLRLVFHDLPQAEAENALRPLAAFA
ncbi:MAG: FAD-binding oxidoreductase, partial [Acetobacteraceae bacterium]|nr:FAD-binding oxidoreductase [Acetobacteraceae bacterium]